MIPRIADRGHSFVGAGQYYLHDKDAETSERLAWSQTNNLRTNDPEKAMKVMAWTALHAEELKRESEQSLAGTKSTKGAVYSYSLAWHPEQNPTREEMIKAADSSLKMLGLQEHESVIMAHNDTLHKHIHIVANLVHPQTGMTHDTGFDKLKSQAWASNFEKEQGKIYCNEREENAEKRKNGEAVKYQDGTMETPIDIAKLYLASDNGAAFKNALEEQGITLANGDKNRIVIVSETGKIQNLARQIKGVKAKDIREKLSDIEFEKLPNANKVKHDLEQARRDQQAHKTQIIDDQKKRQRRDEQNKVPFPPKQDNVKALAHKAARQKMRSRHRHEWALLSDKYRLQKKYISDQYHKDKADLKDGIYAQWKPHFRDLYKQQWSERQAFERREKTLLGKAENILVSLKYARAIGRESDKNILTTGFNSFSMKGKRHATLNKIQEEEIAALRRKQREIIGQSVRGLNDKRGDKMKVAHALFQENRTALIQKQRADKKSLERQSLQQSKESSALDKAFSNSAGAIDMKKPVLKKEFKQAHANQNTPTKGKDKGFDLG